jgi:hypothetical protein
MRKYRFTFLCDEEERRLLAGIAACQKRSQGDAIRLLIRAASHELNFMREISTDKEEMRAESAGKLIQE